MKDSKYNIHIVPSTVVTKDVKGAKIKVMSSEKGDIVIMIKRLQDDGSLLESKVAYTRKAWKAINRMYNLGRV